MLFGRYAVRALLCSSLLLLASCSSCDVEPNAPPSANVPAQVYSGFDFVKDAFAFANFGGEGSATQINTAVMERMFGADAVCVPELDPCVLLPQAKLWMDGTNLTLDQGRSEGFALLSLMFFTGELNPQDFGSPTVAGLTLDGNIALQEELAYWSATQAVPSANRDDVRHEAKDVMSFLAQALSSNAQKRYRLAIAQRTDKGFTRGHALTPIGYFKDNEREGTYWVRVYDNNFPQRERLLEVNVPQNTWRYEVPGVDGTPIVYEGSNERQNYLYFSSAKSRTGVLPAPFAQDSEYVTQSYSGVTIVASNEDGQETGIRDGQVLEAEGDWVMPAFSRCPLCGTAVAIVNQATLAKGFKPKNKITISSTPDAMTSVSGGGGSVSIQSSGLGYTNKLESSDPKIGDTATFDDGDVSYASTSNTGGVKITTTRYNGDGTTTTVSVTVDASDAGGVQVELKTDDSGKTTVEVSGLPQGVDVTINATTTQRDSGAQTSNEFTYTSNGAPSVASVGTSNTEVKLETTPADAAICKNGQKDTSETDQDCGGACGPTCADGKICVNDGDCAKGYCERGICESLDPMCNSGRKSPGESDVDCGGSTCPACVATKSADSPACVVSADCDTKLCEGGRCRFKYPIFVTFDQLPEGNYIDLFVKLDGVTTRFSKTLTQGVLEYEIGSAYSFQFVSANRCTPTTTSALTAGPTGPNDMTARGTLPLRCPLATTKQMLVNIQTNFINSFVSENLKILETDPIKFALSVDGGPIRIVDVNTNYVNLGTYQNTWAIALIQNPRSDQYKFPFFTTPSGLGRMRIEKTFVSSFSNNWTDQGLYIADSTIPEVRYAFRYVADDNGNNPSCVDLAQNLDETSYNCGGSCGGCAKERLCLVSADCAAGLNCMGYVCRSSGTCSDGIKNQDEADVDCGGSCATKCGSGKICGATVDCDSGLTCSRGTCQLGCTNGFKDTNETDVDCGGVCSTACAVGKSCLIINDCVMGSACINQTCASGSCSNALKDGLETGVDCGNDAGCGPCDRGQGCMTGADCFANSICAANTCVAMTCTNGVKDGNETDVDCGGPDCARCQSGQACMARTDCVNVNRCESGICSPAACNNFRKDANETDVDCGDAAGCGPCENKKGCATGADCRAGSICSSGLCVLPTCTNGVKDGGESSIDCGGSDCSPCQIGQYCTNHGDCFQQCTNNACAVVECSNGQKDLNESDVDCGGSSLCLRCAPLKMCTVSSDCAMNNVCSNGICAAMGCANGVKDGSETDIDCGGGSCNACVLSKACTLDSDCASNDCECGASSGSCAGSTGRCGAGKWLSDTPVTDAAIPSASITIPASCPAVYVQVWGGAGGASDDGFGFVMAHGGAAGHVAGDLSVAAGDTLELWIGTGGGQIHNGLPGFGSGYGSRYGILAIGGGGDRAMGFGAQSGGGGGLTSVRLSGANSAQFVVPGGAGASEMANGADVAFGTGGGAVGSDGQRASATFEGGGGAGESGGLADQPGTYSALPAGLSSADSVTAGVPANSANPDYASCGVLSGLPAGAADTTLFNNTGGDGCAVIRCVAP